MRPWLSILHAEFRGKKTTARLCDIDARVMASGGSATINIEILTDTSKLGCNEALYL